MNIIEREEEEEVCCKPDGEGDYYEEDVTRHMLLKNSYWHQNKWIILSGINCFTLGAPLVGEYLT